MAESEETPEERRARWRSITIGGRAAGQTPTDPDHIRPMQEPKWEGGRIYEDRPGGFRVPLVHDHNPSQPITNKQYANNRTVYDNERERRRLDPHGLSER